MTDAAPSTPEPTLEEARAAKPEAESIFAELVEGASIGITRVGAGYGLKVNIQAEAGKPLPTSVLGIPVKVEVVGPIKKRPS